MGYPFLDIAIDGDRRIATFRIAGPDTDGSARLDELGKAGAGFWPLALARALDDAILHLRTNRPEIGTWVLTSTGAAAAVAAHDDFLLANQDNWLAREITLYWKRVLKRLDASSRSMIALIEPGSCFTGSLFELVLAADRSYMLDDDPAPTVALTGMNFGALSMANGLSRLATRFLDDDAALEAVRAVMGDALEAGDAEDLGLVTFIPDSIDWDDEVRLAVEERASFSPDALTGMEASLRFAGPETMETKIFGRLTAWQNWIFQRSNAVGPDGALTLYGSGQRSDFDMKRV